MLMSEFISNMYDLMLTIPQFQEFVKENENKSTNQIIEEYGLDISRRKNVYKSKP